METVVRGSLMRLLKRCPKVYIIILNYNGWADTIECLESVLKNDYPNYQVIVVDNNSPNNSMEYIKAWTESRLDVWVHPDNSLRNLSFPPVPKPIPYVYYTREEAEKGGDKEKESKLNNPLIFIQAGENGGYSSGNNIGIEFCKAQKDCAYFMICNNDIVFEKHTIKQMLHCMQKRKKTAISPLVMNYFDKTMVDSKGFGYINLLTSQTTHNDKNNYFFYFKYLVGSIILVDVNAPFMDVDYFLYYDDVDYSKKLILNGYDLVYCNNAVVYHKVSASTKKLNHFIEYIKIDSMIKFYKKHYKFIVPQIFLLRLFYYLSKWRFSYIKRLFKNVF